MAAYGRPSLRDLFDEAPTPFIAHPPSTHHRDYYIATDGSYRSSGGGLGVVIETRDGERVTRLSLPDDCPDNNVAEYRALHLGLDVLAERAPPSASVGLLVDHDDLAGNVNLAILAARGPTGEPPRPVRRPRATDHHWRGIRARIHGFGRVRAARLDSDRNPAHPLANSPDEYAHVDGRPRQCVMPTAPTSRDPIPPPSRADRPSSD